MDKKKSCGSCGKYKTCHQRGIINPCDDWQAVTSIKPPVPKPPKGGTGATSKPTEGIDVNINYAKIEARMLAPMLSEIQIPPINNPMFDICIEGLRIIATNEIIPSDEPVFILLGRSKNAGACLRTFQSQFEMMSEDHKNMDTIIEAFGEYDDDPN